MSQQSFETNVYQLLHYLIGPINKYHQNQDYLDCLKKKKFHKLIKGI